MEGFEAFELLRPTDDRDTFLVYTRWRSEEDFERWVNSQAFGTGTRQHTERGSGGHRTRAAGSSTSSSTRSRVRRDVDRRPMRSRSSPGPGGPFEIVVEDVARRPDCRSTSSGMRSLRELMAQSAAPRRRRLGRAGRPAAHATASTTRAARVRRARRSRELGVERGDRVALVLGEQRPSGSSCSGRARCSAPSLVPLNAWWKAEELEFGLARLRARRC